MAANSDKRMNWREIAQQLRLLLGRPPRQQYAALCYRMQNEQIEFLLITSRDTGRWVIPKGWPMKELNAAECAAQEAFEEAGVIGDVSPTNVGTYFYFKGMDAGYKARCLVDVFPLKVQELRKDYPEEDERTRSWMSAEEASAEVEEPGLRAIFKTFAPPKTD
ncbi:MAG: NUDIX hydrolase [Stappiaceae bacterium]